MWPWSPSSRGLTDVIGCGGISCLLFDFFSSNAHGLLQVRSFFLLTYRSNWDEARPRERLGRDCFLPIGQSSLFIPGCIRIWSHGLVNLSVRLCMCNLRGLHSLRERFETEFHTPGIYGSGRVWVNAWDVFRHTPNRCCRGCRAAVDSLVCLGAAGFRVFVFDIFPSKTHGLLQG